MSSSEPPLPRAALPGLAQDMLACLLTLKGRTKEAVDERRVALQKLEQVLGPDHPELQPSFEQLTFDLLRLEDFAAASAILQRTYDYRVTHLGPDHPDTLERLGQLAECLLKTGMPASAQPLLERLLASSAHLLGPEHEDTLTTMMTLAKACAQQGDRAYAEGLLLQSQAGFERTLGLVHPKSLASLYAVFEHFSEGADTAASEPWAEKLLTATQQAHGCSHPLTISAAALASDLYVRRQDFASAVAVFRRVLDAFPHNQPQISLEQARLQSKLAACLDLAGENVEAEALARSAAYAFHMHLGPSHAETERAYRHTIDLSTRRSLRTPWGRFYLRCLSLIGRLLRLRHKS